METLNQRIEKLQVEMISVLRQWDMAVENPQSTMEQRAFIRLRIDGLERELDHLMKLSQGKVA